MGSCCIKDEEDLEREQQA